MKKDHTFIVGDVHGCFDELMLLLKKAQYRPGRHRLIFVGDLVNKGKKSFKLLKWVREHRLKSVIGNHELKFIHDVENKLPLTKSLFQLKLDMGNKLEDWLNYIKSWPLFIEEKDFIVVHAGLVPGEHPRESKTENLVNMRHWNIQTKSMCFATEGRPWHEYYKGSKLVVYGHWARQGVLKKSNCIGLDSGCVYGRSLTGVFLPSRTLVSVNAHFY